MTRRMMTPASWIASILILMDVAVDDDLGKQFLKTPDLALELDVTFYSWQ